MMKNLKCMSQEELAEHLRAIADEMEAREGEEKDTRDISRVERWVLMAKLWEAEGYVGQNSRDPDDSFRYILDAQQNPSYVEESMALSEHAFKKRSQFWKSLDRYHADWIMKGKK